MNSVNVVIDTNVFIAALKSKRGISYKLLLLLPNNIYTPNISVPLFVEYESVAKRKGLLDNLRNEDIDIILDYFLSKSKIREIFYLWRPFLRDIKDDLVLEVAVESSSKYIITFNKKDFKDCNKFGIEVVTPHEFMKIKGVTL